MKRVVITGLGIVSCIGNNQEEVHQSLLNSKSGISYSEEYKNHVAKSNLPGNVGFSFGEPHHPDRNWTTRQRWFKPKKNLLIMFPSLLEHFVIPFHTDVERVSVSGNIYILNKEKLQLNDKGDPRDRQHEFYF